MVSKRFENSIISEVFLEVKKLQSIFFVIISGLRQLIAHATFSGAATVTQSEPVLSIERAPLAASSGAPT